MATELKISTDLIEISEDNALDKFTTPSEVDRIVGMVRARALAGVANLKDVGLYDVSTDEGRGAIRSLAHKVTKSRTALEKIGADVTRELKELPNKVIAGKNKFTEEIDKIQAEVRKPLTDYEALEEARKQAHLTKIESLKGYVATRDTDQETIRGLLAAAEAVVVGPENEEFEDGYRLAKENAIAGLTAALAARVQYDADQLELAGLRELQRVADEERAEADRQTKERERLQVIEQEAALRAQRDAQKVIDDEAAKHAAELAEIERKAEHERGVVRANEAIAAAKIKTEEEETRRREASKLNQRKVAAEAVAALMLKVEGLTEKMALDVVRAIAKKEVPHLQVIW